MKKTVSTVHRIAVITGLALGAFALSALGWSGPPPNPPNPPPTCPAGYPGCDAPLNVGPNTQEKLGGLWIHKGVAIDGNLIVSTSSPVAGYVLTAADNLGTVKWAAGGGGGGSSSGKIGGTYSLVYGVPGYANTPSYTDSSIFLTVTPASASSKFLINANIIAVNGSNGGNCQLRLVRGATPLVVFSNHEFGTWDAAPVGVTYIDAATDTSQRTYKIQTSGICFFNESAGGASSGNPGGGDYKANSTMSIVEIQ